MKKFFMFLFVFLSVFVGINIFAYEISKNDKLYVSGQSIGIKLNSGVEVVGTFGVNLDGKVYKPWEECGLKEGDKIISLNDKEIEKTDDLLSALKFTNGDRTEIKFLRGTKQYSSFITPVVKNEEYSLGLYIKDSILGVGTLTYYIKEANIFGSLGHKITNDSFYSGEIYEARVDSIIKPQRNQAGEKKAIISNEKIGTIVENTITGVHGNGSSNIDLSDMRELYFKTREEIEEGEAEIWTCVDGDKIEKFDIVIKKLEKQKTKDIKGITFEVVDEDLISKSGGIVQGMSGSPIVQDNKLVGAVTHVSIKDPTLAYGIYIEWMFEDMGVTVVE